MKKTFLIILLAAAGLSVSILGTESPAWALTFGEEGGIEHKDKMVSPVAAAMDDNGKIHIAWFEEEKERVTLHSAVSEDAGKTFAPGVAVNKAEEEPDSTHQSPSLALGPKGEVFVVWKSKRPGEESAADLRFSRSLDGGKTFEKSVVVNDNPGPGFVGFESIAAGPKGEVYAAWIDKREKDPKAKPSAYFARSLDGGKSFEKNVKVDGSACVCCRTALAVGSNGRIYMGWRKALDKDIREIVVAGSTDGGKTFAPPVIVGNDQWEFAGCPHRGPSLGVDKEGRLYVAWYSEGEGMPQIYLGRSSDGGASFSKEVLKVQPGFFPDHPALVVTDAGICVVWEEVTPLMGKIIIESRPWQGEAVRQQLSQGNRRAAYPSIVANRKGEVLAAWTKEEVKFKKSLVRIGR